MSKKKIITIISLLVVLVLSVSAVSYSIANFGAKNGEKEDSELLLANGGLASTYKSNIDLIIENSYNGEKFNIVEVVSAGYATPKTSLQQYIEKNYFKNMVIDDHKTTATQNMKDKMINYTFVEIAPETKIADIKADLLAADLIYLSSSAYDAYTGVMDDEIYEFFHTYAMRDNKPMIMDFVKPSDTGTAGSKRISTLIGEIGDNYIRYKTYPWDDTITAKEFFDGSKSYYNSFNTNSTKYGNPTGKVLVIKKSKDLPDLSTDPTDPEADYLYNKIAVASDDDGNPTSTGDYAADVYFGNKKPARFQTDSEVGFVLHRTGDDPDTDEVVEAGDFTFVEPADVFDVDFDDYDFIIIESDVTNSSLSTKAFNKLKSASESGKFILYNANIKKSSGSSSGADANGNNYRKLMSMLMTANGLTKRTNVLAVRPTWMETLLGLGTNGTEGAASIAKIIDAANYRTAADDGDNGKIYKVLEIEPCYPIDTELAATKKAGTSKNPHISGGYYERPADVLKGVTKDEIASDQEYYAFEISKAKIAKATGWNYNQIQIDQMSVNELISSKEVISETYDLVYIGSDFSAYVPAAYYYFDGIANSSADSATRSAWDNYFTFFNMYTHTGGYMTSKNISGKGIPYADLTDKMGDTFVEYSGHDLSTIKLDELKTYVTSGLPVIIEAQLATAYTEASKMGAIERYTQRNIDPDSNMYKFLSFAFGKKDQANVGWGLYNVTDTSIYTQTNNSAGKNGEKPYGATIGDTATVYSDDVNAGINSLFITVDGEKLERPFVKITDKPKEYNRLDKTTTNETTTVSVSYEVTGAEATTVQLLVDEDGDGVFEEDEEKDSASALTGSLSYELEDGFFGLVSWKVLASSKVGDYTLYSQRTGAAYFKPDKDMQKTVKVLQIMPYKQGYTFTKNNGLSGGLKNETSLLLCTDCQQVNEAITKNPVVDAQDRNESPGIHSNSYGTAKYAGIEVADTGDHDHNFGIVSYNTSSGWDDWDDNLAYDITHNEDGGLEGADFEFELDIITVEDFDKFAESATKRNSSQIELNNATTSYWKKQYQLAAKSAALVAAENNLKADLFKAAEAIKKDASASNSNFGKIILKGIGTEANPGHWIVDRDYYKYFEYTNEGSAGANLANVASNVNNGGVAAQTIVNDYAAFVKEENKAIFRKNEYIATYRYDGDDGAADASTLWLNNYDIVVLGFADNFNNRDLSEESAAQLKRYVQNDGSILNTHDAMTKYKKYGAVNLTNALRESFGMDRFHVTGLDDGSGELTATYRVLKGVKSNTFRVGNSQNGTWQEVTVKDKDITIYYDVDNNKVTKTTEATTNINPDVAYITVVTVNSAGTKVDNKQFYVKEPLFYQNNGGVEQVNSGSEGYSTYNKWYVQGSKGYDVVYEYDSATTNIPITEHDYSGKWDVKTNTLTGTEGTSNVMSDKTYVSLSVVDNGTKVPANTEVIFKYNKTVTSTQKTNQSGYVYFTYEADLNAKNTSAYDMTDTTTKYRKYKTSDPSKYFFTKRLTGASNDKGASYMKYNSPVGVTDMWVADDCSSDHRSCYRYVTMSEEAFDHDDLEVDGTKFKAKYGTRTATKINQGGVTTFPFAVADELRISGTHAQYFALDIEDPNVSVWYALGANPVDKSTINGIEPVSEQFARYDSGIFAASPNDGMNAYFLYSKNNVFYTGAGHARITGAGKDNNDERMLFLNVIVNSVSKGKVKPKLKLYNVATDAKNDESGYVDPKDLAANAKLAKEINKLYYNSSIGMYQYNIDEGDFEDGVYPTFDYRAIAGSVPLSEIHVFWDLDYGSADSDDAYDSTDGDHVSILEYEGKDAKAQSGVRDHLNSTIDADKFIADPVLDKDGKVVKKSYMDNYTNCCYIVITAEDENNNILSARVKITVLPHLFDLTDSTIDYPHYQISNTKNTLDISDKKEFNI